MPTGEVKKGENVVFWYFAKLNSEILWTWTKWNGMLSTWIWNQKSQWVTDNSEVVECKVDK